VHFAMSAYAQIEILAGRLRAANALGRSESLRHLFDFLVSRSGDPATPKETEVAAAIFSAGANFDASQDASVRVYIHRLRQKLDDYYNSAGRHEAERLAIPKGIGYRLIAEPQGAAPLPATAPSLEAPPRRWHLRHWAIVAGVCALLLTNALAWVFIAHTAPKKDAFAAVRAHPLWDQFLSDHRSITLVVGDYYIFGELTGKDGGNRLVREYDINSPADLDDYLMHNPGAGGRYMNLDLFYLPSSIASALKSIMPILAPDAATRDRVHVVQASDLTADLIKRTDVIYLGYLSGLGVMKEIVFSGSRFAVGDTYDELIDNRGKQHYVSQEGGPGQPAGKLTDYAYFSTFQGPGGNRIMVIAGTRDVSVMQLAEALTDPDSLATLSRAAHGAPAFEALYEMEGMKGVNLGGHLLTASPIRSEKIWNGKGADLHFPNG
jgi:hypothetical protein